MENGYVGLHLLATILDDALQGRELYCWYFEKDSLGIGENLGQSYVTLLYIQTVFIVLFMFAMH